MATFPVKRMHLVRLLIGVFGALVFASACEAGCNDPNGKYDPKDPSCWPSPGGGRSGGSGSGGGSDTAGQIAAGLSAAASALQQYQDAQQQAEAQRAREAAAQAQREAAAEAQRKLQQQQEEAAQRQANAAAQADPQLNPFGKSTKGSSKSSSVATKNANNFSPPDPSQNLEGKSCSFLTRAPDAAHSNSYAEGAPVVYGDRYYQCENGRWKYMYPAAALSNDDRNRLDANQQEKSSVSTNIFEEE